MPPLTEQSWYEWHAPYDALDTAQTDRLAAVQDLLYDALDSSPPGALRAVSACSGQARDLLPVLIHHPRGADVSARMIESDPLNASFLHGALGSTRLVDVDVLEADAGNTAAYEGAAPADLVVLGGVFANIGAGDAERTVEMLPSLCTPGAQVVWTTYGTDGTEPERILTLLDGADFDTVEIHRSTEHGWTAAAHRYRGTGRPLPADVQFFDFIA
ncbi:SAM-dependent methyltransferase [Rhodococcus sp. Rp3]|uniref:SAM-dependent methyltransferase n=1 Tax=Rhodococcus sp. Rp3 TaxID=2807635 RepID=UPI00233F75BB|nr:SAM-dependent methyltransferase [Rhodococcus sp. Rp3]MDC3727385.1 SAM-dependent methyltransferase [Rhodococcus sp. Rp3]